MLFSDTDPKYFRIIKLSTSYRKFPAMAIPLVLLSFLLIVFLAYRVYQRLRFKLPPGPQPWPIVGNLYDVKPVRFRCYDEWSKRYGPIISVWLGSSLHVIVSNVELAKEVLKEHDHQLADRHRHRTAAQFSRNGADLIWADYGPHYVKVRKLCNMELFSAKRLEALRPIREDEYSAMVESIFKYSIKHGNEGKSLIIRKYLGSVSLNNITRLAFGKRFEDSDGKINEYGKEFEAINEIGRRLSSSLTVAEHIPWLRWMFPLEKEVFDKHGARRDRFTTSILKEHDLARQSSGNSEQHFVDALLSLKGAYELSEDNVIGLLWDMIAAGKDTTAISVEWALAELIKNPRIQLKAQEELDRVIGLERVMTEVDFPNLPYLQCIAKEALRLHPPTPLMLPHQASVAIKIKGYDIPKGTIVHVNVWAVARDPTIWKTPLEFRPERFLEEEVDMKGHDFRLLPFGSGRRVCPGAQLGINMVTSMLGHLLHFFEWAPAHGIKAEEMDMEEGPGLVTYMRTPLQAVVTPRLPSNLYKRTIVDV